MNEALATLTICRMPRMTLGQAHLVLRHYGTAAAAMADEAPTEPNWAAARADTKAFAEAVDRARVELDYYTERGIRLLPYAGDDYPQLLRDKAVRDAPLLLYYLGNAPLNDRHTLSVVGTRHITDYGRQMAERIVRDLAERVPDVLIVSGLAYGVDINAHRAALAGGLDTVGVLAHGLDRIYPAVHRRDAVEMVHHGGLLTEYPIDTTPAKGNFVQRNRIVAGMSRATLVIESAEHGGSLITARAAGSYGRDVLAVPGRVGDEMSRGCNKLIRRSIATLVTSADDILSVLGWESAAQKSQKEPRLFPDLTPEQMQVVEALRGSDGLTLNQIVGVTGLAISQLTDIFFDLEDLDVVRKLPGNRYRLA